LQSLPRTLDETYESIILNIPPGYQTKAITALQWIMYSIVLLTLGQVSDTIAINPKADPPFNLEDRLPDPYWILDLLPGILTIKFHVWPTGESIGTRQIVEFAHFSVVEYLTSNRIANGPASLFYVLAWSCSLVKDNFLADGLYKALSRSSTNFVLIFLKSGVDPNTSVTK
jgi:hypothetical protein